LQNSFLSNYEIIVINNGIDLQKFQSVNPLGIINKYNIYRKYVLGVARVWTKRKGLEDFIKLRNLVNPEIDIILVGLSPNEIKSLPPTIKCIPRTESIEELAALYSGAEVFVNPTYVDNFPTVNIEALACGTPVITYNTGGSGEIINEDTGIIVEKGDLLAINNAINKVLENGKFYYVSACRKRAELLFDKNARFADYIDLYKDIIDKQ
jgi:glycosyltransferase involved in cell wall biosynthesis